MNPCASSRSNAPYSVPARSRTRLSDRAATSWITPYPCRGPSASAVSTRNVGSCRGTSLMTRIVRAPVYAGKARSAVRQQVRVPLGDEPGYLAQRLGRLVLAVLALGQAVEQRHRIGAQFGLGGGAPDHG